VDGVAQPLHEVAHRYRVKPPAPDAAESVTVKTAFSRTRLHKNGASIHESKWRDTPWVKGQLERIGHERRHLVVQKYICMDLGFTEKGYCLSESSGSVEVNSRMFFGWKEEWNQTQGEW